MIALLLVPFFLLFLADGVDLIKKKLWRELVVMSLLIGIAGSLVIVQKTNLPTPIDIFHKLLKPIGKLIF